MRNNLKRFFAEQITDLKYYFFSVCVVILSRDRSKIVRLVHKDAASEPCAALLEGVKGGGKGLQVLPPLLSGEEKKE